MRCVAASSKTRPVTADARGSLYQIRLLLRASRDRLTKRQQERLREAFTADEAHISVEVAYLLRPASPRRLPPRHTRPRTTPGRTSHRAPTNVSHPRNRSPGPDPTQVGRTHSTPPAIPTEPATHRTEAINGHHRTRQAHRQRLPQHHQLPTPNAPHRRRPRRLHPHSTLKSPENIPLAAPGDALLAGRSGYSGRLRETRVDALH